MSKLIDLTGQRFGHLTVRYRILPNRRGSAVWHCECDCGNEVDVRGESLRSGHTQSCGCIKADRISQAHIIHGKRHTRLYRIWLNMKNRCDNPNYWYYNRYGGRGIKVCEEWARDFQTFYDWAISNGYKESLSIDRIDNDKGYFPENCRWATHSEQTNNTSKNHIFVFNGESLTVTQWCEKLKINKHTYYYRIAHGWTIEEALELVPRKK